ncbi:putative secreted protein [Saccharothrix espanaensis DSM 44229]|uniref:Putative secreted protein n=1 Tax=Saccharothrix espanaensis (strain ATCC 51144 / DSM 44229 / JCM 9112 / NBRC 15066 / NRRL 15764) TaxID=1179773 RepID=K0JSZ6_SACES|nr:putative secreted protein [Saccharothrix espanaensis DSM 44229]
MARGRPGGRVTKLLLSLHVLAAIVAIGPVTVAASAFPATARRAFAAPDHDLGPVRTLHRIRG